MRPYQILDVFTATPLAGNPLAVVFEADGLTSDACQAIAREFNLSETIFLAAPEAGGTHRARIFTPMHKMPFAGHPTVGGAIAAAQRRGAAGEIGLELPAGLARCTVADGPAWSATIAAPLPPRLEPGALSPDDLARLLGLPAAAIGFDNYTPSRAYCGPRWTIVPLADVAALGATSPEGFDARALGEGYESLYLVTREGEGFRARMYAPAAGVAEDPATGSAAVAFTALIAAAERPADGRRRTMIRQGIEMGRPSDITVEATFEGGAATSVDLSGEAVVVAEGTLRV